MSNTQEELERNCRSVAEDVEQFLDPDMGYSVEDAEFFSKEENEEREDDGLYGYLQDGVYDIKLVTDLQGSLYSCRLMVAGGGPNIYIDTGDCEVQGYWGCDEVHIPLDRRICERIDDEIEQMRY